MAKGESANSAIPLSGHTQLAAVIGYPVRHSLSPAIHNAGFAALGLDWAYLAFEVAPDQGEAAVRAMIPLGIRGLSVTMPHKDAAASAVDELTPEAEALGAVNCVVNHDGHLVGHNTDGDGFVASLRTDHGFEPAGRRCVVLGAGGAARSVIVALAGAGATDIAVVNRTPNRAVEAARLAGEVGRVADVSEVAAADLVVNATSIGMGASPGNDESDPADLPVAPELLQSHQVVADLITHPRQTPLLLAAERRGATPVPGLGMLVHQAALAFSLWTGQEAPIAAMWEAVKRT